MLPDKCNCTPLFSLSITWQVAQKFCCTKSYVASASGLCVSKFTLWAHSDVVFKALIKSVYFCS